MACVKKLQRRRGRTCFGFFVGSPFDFTVVTVALKARGDVVHFVVCVEGIFLDTEFITLTSHYVDGIMEDAFDDEITLLRQDDVGFGKISQRYGQRANVIVVAMRNGDGVNVFLLDGLVERDAFTTFSFGVHSSVEQDAMVFYVHEP